MQTYNNEPVFVLFPRYFTCVSVWNKNWNEHFISGGNKYFISAICCVLL